MFDGQSLNQYPDSIAYKNPELAMASAAPGVPYSVAAINGTGWYTLTNTKASRLHPLFKQCRNSVLMMNGGTADIAQVGATTAGVIESFRAYAQAARDAGCDMVVAYTITPAFGFTAPQETIRQEVNALIVANAGNPAYWDDVVDIAADSRFTNPLNGTYYVDGLHYTQAGHTAAASIIAPVLARVLQQLQLPAYKG